MYKSLTIERSRQHFQERDNDHLQEKKNTIRRKYRVRRQTKSEIEEENHREKESHNEYLLRSKNLSELTRIYYSLIVKKSLEKSNMKRVTKRMFE